MANTDLMIDLETLATSNDAAIVTMAAIRFDPHADYSKIKVEDLPPNQVMYKRIDLDSCTAIGCKVNEETINWWATQSKEAQDEAFGDDGDRITIQDAMKELRKFSFGIKAISYLLKGNYLLKIFSHSFIFSTTISKIERIVSLCK